LEVKSNNFLTIICKELTLQPNKRKIITLEASIPKFKLHWKKKFEFAAVTTFLKKNIIDKILYVYTNDTTLPTFEKNTIMYTQNCTGCFRI